ncbi:BlaI/MecI/CopY family transcriptional regulator [Dorea acetigenes]|jgi:predicted transcriptional regulator|uniref:BlaI/MecI/CopY family transcriptional regulator n=1 Tax=Dorea acetigenes TaxID=2981787 RepID=A0ABT2RKV4_9FIRM|nr:BlaI/MecI/CopY family transcriptional regulator [Dorea acetigenes]MCU6685981.1 BlaI/MecI/CopY family transcriptional regulator [Dorea acetigenes]
MMFQKEKHLTNSEEDLMEIFWEKKEPLTSVEILELSAERSWNGNYIHKMLRSLLKKDMIKICGTVQCGTQYARQFIPAVTKEEYAAKLVMSKGIEKSAIAAVTVAMVHEMDGADGEDVVKQLEDIIEELKGKGSGEK